MFRAPCACLKWCVWSTLPRWPCCHRRMDRLIFSLPYFTLRPSPASSRVHTWHPTSTNPTTTQLLLQKRFGILYNSPCDFQNFEGLALSTYMAFRCFMHIHKRRERAKDYLFTLSLLLHVKLVYHRDKSCDKLPILLPGWQSTD